MLTQKEYTEIVNSAIGDVQYPTWLPGLYEPIKYALAAGGKRLRPVLLLAACDAFGGDRGQSIWPALGVEIFHNFTLVHDDVMDHADMRRGRPTVYKKWDLNTAILSGDAMASMAYKCMAGCPPMFLPEIIDRFGIMTMQVYEGQQLDGEFETRTSVTFDEYLQMIMRKTSALIAYPCAMGALIAGASQDDIEAIFNFGNLIGIAFQMQDDYLDVYGDPATFGKAIGGDILNDKKTWLHIMARDRDNNGDFARLLSLQLTPEEKIARVTAHYDSLDLRTVGTRLVDNYLRDALHFLDQTTLSDQQRDWFADFARNLVGRKA